MPVCKHCGSEALVRRGYTDNRDKVRVRCNECGGWDTIPIDEPEETKSEYTYTESGSSATIQAELDVEIRTADDLIKALNIDTKIWQIDKFQVGKSIAYRKDRRVKWEVQNGKVTHGSVDDSGELLLKPVFSVKVWMSRKTEEIRAGLALDDFKREVYQFAPRQIQLQYPPSPSNGMLYEIEMPDIHLGKLTWGEETGEDSDVKIQVENAKNVMRELLSYTKNCPIEKILFPIGNDYYNVDNQFNTTAHGTPQQEDTRWRKTFKIGWTLAAEMINMCSVVAPVDVLIIPGNHDEERSYYLGEVLSALYSNSSRVQIDNSAKARKYYPYGSVLLALTHGYHEKVQKLKDILLYEAKGYLDNAKFIEWHTGDKHHKEDYVHKTYEAENGVVIRLLRSLTSPDAFHYNKGYNGALKASEAFLWDRDKGLKAQFTATP